MPSADLVTTPTPIGFDNMPDFNSGLSSAAGVSIPSPDYFGGASPPPSNSFNLALSNPGPGSSPSIGTNSSGSKYGWAGAMQGIQNVAGLANAGLGIYSALNRPGPQTSEFLRQQQGPNAQVMGGNRQMQAAPLSIPNQQNKIPNAGGGPGQGAMPNSSHFAVLMQLLGVPRG